MTNEDREQIAIMDWSLTVRNQYPELKLLYHVANERKCSPQQGQLLKRKGVKRGVPDMFLPVPRGGYCGLYIELKADGGRVSKDQAWWLKELEEQGYCTCICLGWQDAAKTLQWYLKLGVCHDG